MAGQLSHAQASAVEHDLGPLLVLAGAGSGKTRVVTQRIARLVSRGTSTRNILAVTFTNKAAAEMRHRVEGLIGTKATKDLTVATFHKFGLGVLRAEARALGLRGSRFVVYDQADCSGVVREVMRTIRSDRGFDIGAILARISAAKNAFVEPEGARAWFEKQSRGVTEYDDIAAEVYPRYIAMMRGFQAFDFDDLLCQVVHLFRKREDLRIKYAQKFRYVIVDEYQDTNSAQLELLRCLAQDHRNVMVVGDDDQSIYAWRGADVRNILEFEQHFPGAKVVKLEENYRSSSRILAVAAVILKNSGAKRHQKSIVATRGAGDAVTNVLAADSEIEAKFVADTIEELVRTGEKRPKDFAILYRSNLQAQELETALREQQIPYRVFGGTQFFERKEVKDMVAYLKVAFDPRDEISLRRIVNYPARGIGEVALDKISSFATMQGSTLHAAVANADAIPDLQEAAKSGARALCEVLEAARTRFAGGMPSAEVARQLVDDVKLKQDVFAGSASNAAATRRWQNIESMLGVFARRDAAGKGDKAQFEEFLRILALREDGEEEGNKDVVTLTTMHGAKGLEFPVAFVVGLEEGLLPHVRTQTERATDVPLSEASMSVDEERRLFYVACTRAQDRLFLCRAERRAFRGKIVKRTPSRFLLEIPDDLMTPHQAAGTPKVDVDRTLSGSAGLLAALNFKGP